MSEVRAVENVESLAEIGRAAIAHETARVARAAARRELSKQRKIWLDGGGEYWDPRDRRYPGDDDEIFAAHNGREAASAEYRRTGSALRRAIKRAAQAGKLHGK